MDADAAMIGWGVEPAAAFIVFRIVSGNGSLAIPALLRVERVQPRARRLGHPRRHLATGRYVIVDQARHAVNLTREWQRPEPTLP